MKISILFTDGAKQIMMTPENEHEKQAIEHIAPNDELVAVAKKGRFGNENEHAGFSIDECRGGYYRPFENRESLMFVVKDKPKNP